MRVMSTEWWSVPHQPQLQRGHTYITEKLRGTESRQPDACYVLLGLLDILFNGPFNPEACWRL